MRRSMAVALGVAVMVVASGAALASPMRGRKVDHRAWGTVTKVDAQTMTFTIETPQTKKIDQFAVNGATRFVESGKAATFAALKDGVHVKVRFVVENGKDVASAVRVMSPRPAKVMKTTMKSKMKG